MPLQADRTAPGAEGAARKAHYGDGKQPWDIIVEQGWAPEFAAGNVLKYLRRVKDPDHSLQSAQWYWKRLYELAMAGAPRAAFRFQELRELLTEEELVRLAYAEPKP